MVRIPFRFSCTRPESSEKPSWTRSDSARSRPESRQATAKMTGSGGSISSASAGRRVDHAGEADQARESEHQQRARPLRDQLAHQPDVVDGARHQVADAVAGEEGRALPLQVGVEPVAKVVGDGHPDPAHRAAADQDRGEAPRHAGGDPGADRETGRPPGGDPIDAGAEQLRDGGLEQPGDHQQRVAGGERQPVAPEVGQEAAQRMHRVGRENSKRRAAPRGERSSTGRVPERRRGVGGGEAQPAASRRPRPSTPRECLFCCAGRRGTASHSPQPTAAAVGLLGERRSRTARLSFL